LSAGEDNARTRIAVEAMGAKVIDHGANRTSVSGVGVDGLRAPSAAIDCGNSGTSMRLLCGLLAGQGFVSELVGDASLSGRPMRRVIEPLAAMGAHVSGRAGAKPGEIYPPLRVAGVTGGQRLRGCEYHMPMASAQVKSAVLIAGLYSDAVTVVHEPGPTRDHTERMLSYLGAPLSAQGTVSRVDPTGWTRRLEARPLTVPGDPSSAAFIAAAALLAGGAEVAIEGVCVNQTRTGFLDALAAMGGEVKLEGHSSAHEGVEPVADLVIRDGRGARLSGAVLGGDLIVRAIDEVPVLAVVAACAPGSTQIRDAAELRVKESDRVATTAAMLRVFGVEVEERPDGLIIEGKGERRLGGGGGRIDARGDHRIAMAAVIAALVADGEVTIGDAGNVRTSFPNFAELMSALGGDIEWI
jgi:3-phosphoshikimate 1-carboxyvinyltransferase